MWRGSGKNLGLEPDRLEHGDWLCQARPIRSGCGKEGGAVAGRLGALCLSSFGHGREYRRGSPGPSPGGPSTWDLMGAPVASREG